METLRPWIAPLVEAALCLCLGQPLPEDVALRNPLKLVDDDSIHRVRVRDRKFVQVAEWSPATGPVRGILSDSVTAISSTFCRESTESYRRKTRKPLNRNTKGAIIKINEFDIVISHVKAPPEITLSVLDFRVEGCEGSSIFGRPVDITGHSSISSMARKCSRKENGQRNGGGLPNGEGREANVPTDTDSESDASSLRSHACASIAPPASQDNFISQLPNSRRSEKPLAQPRNDSALPKKNATLLLSALTSKSGLEPDPAIKENLDKTAERHKPSSSRLDVDIEHIGFATQLIPSIENAIPLDEEINRNCSGDAESLPPSGSPLARTPRTHISGERSPSLNQNRQRDSAASKRSGDKPRDHLDPQISPEMAKPTTKNKLMPNNSPKTNTQPGKDDPWSQMVRIRRRDVTIRKDQEELIEMNESWFPPEPGKQAPQAHVPIHLLQKWNDMLRRRSSNETTSTCANPHSANEDEDLDADLLKSSPEGEPLDSEWTPTPQPSSSSHLVPQDSSPPAINNSRLRPPFPVKANQRDIVASGNEDDLGYGPDIGTNSQKPADLSTATPIEDEDVHSEMEISPPTGLGNVSQADQDPENDNFTSSVASLPSANKVSFTEVEQTPYIQVGKRKMASATRSPKSIDGDSGQRFTKVSSDPLIPSTYDTRRLTVQPGPSASVSGKATQTATQNPGLASLERFSPLDCGSTDGDDDSIVGGQLVSSLDECAQNTNEEYLDVSVTARALGTMMNTNKPASNSVNVGGSQIEMNSTPSIIGKRKRNEVPSIKDRNLAKQPKIFQSQTSRLSARSFVVRPMECRQPGSERGRSRFGNNILPSKTEGVYNQFKRAYPDYAGSIDNFKQACDKLQRLREQDFMKRSFLWDDFVVQYPAYTLRHRYEEDSSHTISYETYFQKEVTKPRCRKRNLTARDLELVFADRENEHHVAEASLTRNDSRGSSCVNLLGNEQEPSARETPVVHVLPSDEELDDGQELSIPESNHGELLSSPEVDHVDDISGSSDELGAHDTASVELGDPDTSFALSGFEKERVSSDEDIEDKLILDEIAESVEGPHRSLVPSTATKQARSMSLELDFDDDSVILDSSPSNWSEQESDHEGRSDPPNEHSHVSLRSQERHISPPPRSRRPYRRFFRSPPDSVRDPFWNLYNKAKQPGEVNNTDDPKPWYRFPNTPFKLYARNVAKLQADYAFRQDGSKADPIPVDEDGVVRPSPLGDPRGMGSMGWKL
ncbi:hypothetical protein BDDG_05308 [Blastomyces dermatitidis ATCC 18188]|uniref:Shelterin complex subunit TPP1/Est3 domain-containing protein n=1 Tax=Ajellomyces dermatitidis (strain ATCC 18188 / CBS 674.68) TaxID=653446 RepID=F2TGK1_AJEDA|nr:hypothetical protein BDDG_05308 [Blastomyces dermatitidis ATCC 18188]